MAQVVRTGRAARWAGHSAREKRLLLIMAGLIALVLLWLLVIRPLGDARANAEQRLNAAVTDLAKARADAAALAAARAAPAAGAPVPLPVDGFLMTAAGEAGFTNLQVTGDGPVRATVTIPNARSQAFFGWIGQMEARGLQVESLSARPNPDQTIAVQAVLRARGG